MLRLRAKLLLISFIFVSGVSGVVASTLTLIHRPGLDNCGYSCTNDQDCGSSCYCYQNWCTENAAPPLGKRLTEKR